MLSTAPDGVLSDADARAWIVRLLDRVDAGDAHAFCETDDAPAEVLSAAWLGCRLTPFGSAATAAAAAGSGTASPALHTVT